MYISYRNDMTSVITQGTLIMRALLDILVTTYALYSFAQALESYGISYFASNELERRDNRESLGAKEVPWTMEEP